MRKRDKMAKITTRCLLQRGSDTETWRGNEIEQHRDTDEGRERKYDR